MAEDLSSESSASTMARVLELGSSSVSDPPPPPPPLGLELRLPTTVMATILSKLDVRSLCSAAATCRSIRSAALQTLSFCSSFHLLDMAPTADLLQPLLPPNPFLRSMRLDCARLNDSAIRHLARPSLHEIWLHNCERLSGRLLVELGRNCPDLRSLYLSSVAERRGISAVFPDLEELLVGCSHLESLSLVFDVSIFNHDKFAQVWLTGSGNLTSLEIGYIPLPMLTGLLTKAVEAQQPENHIKPPILPSLQKLCLSVDYISDFLVISISRGLPSLTHIDLKDAPIFEPLAADDLSNTGIQEINSHGKLKHISLMRSQEFLFTHFRRVNDVGIHILANTCSKLESICLGGFCRVTDAGYRAIIHTCSSLRKLKVSHGSQLTDLVFHDISATSLSLTHVSLRWCNLLSNLAVKKLSSNRDLNVLDLSDCRNLGDGAVKALSSLPKLQRLHLDGTDITDVALSYLGSGVCPLISLSISGCKRLTNNCITSIFGGSFGSGLQVLDLSRLPNLSDDGIFSLAKSRVPIVELRIRECPQIGDSSVMALASMHVEGGSHGSSLHLLDLYECGGITPLAFRWFKKPYFPRLKWLGVTGSLNRMLVDALAVSRPFLHVACRGEEIGKGYWDSLSGWYGHEEDELDELEQWLMEGEDDTDPEDMHE